MLPVLGLQLAGKLIREFRVINRQKRTLIMSSRMDAVTTPQKTYCILPFLGRLDAPSHIGRPCGRKFRGGVLGFHIDFTGCLFGKLHFG